MEIQADLPAVYIPVALDEDRFLAPRLEGRRR